MANASVSHTQFLSLSRAMNCHLPTLSSNVRSAFSPENRKLKQKLTKTIAILVLQSAYLRLSLDCFVASIILLVIQSMRSSLNCFLLGSGHFSQPPESPPPSRRLRSPGDPADDEPEEPQSGVAP